MFHPVPLSAWFLLSLTGIFLLLPVLTPHLIFSILRHTFISKASNLVMSSFLIVLNSAQYKVTLQISVFTILFLRHLHSSQSPLVILSSWTRLLSHCYPGASILGSEGRDHQILGRVIAGRVAGGSFE